MKTSTILLVGGLAVGGFLVYKATRPEAREDKPGGAAGIIGAGTGFLRAFGDIVDKFRSPRNPTEDPATGSSQGVSGYPPQEASPWRPLPYVSGAGQMTRVSQIDFVRRNAAVTA